MKSDVYIIANFNDEILYDNYIFNKLSTRLYKYWNVEKFLRDDETFSMTIAFLYQK